MRVRPLVPLFVWLLVAVAVTAGSVALQRVAPSERGLVRSFYPDPELDGRPLLVETVPTVDLAFLETYQGLPRRFFGVRWHGYWLVPERQTIELFAGADDEVDVRVDGRLVLRRNAEEGRRTASRTLTLAPGAREVVVEYAQHAGGAGLNVQWAPLGEPARPLDPQHLFPERIGRGRYRLMRLESWMDVLVSAVWLAGPAIPLLMLARRPVRRAWAHWRAVSRPHGARELARRVLMGAAPALVVPVELFLLGPHTIHHSNPGEFSVPFGQIALPWLLVPACLTWLSLVGVGVLASVISRSAARTYASLLLMVGLVLWAQGNLLVGDYGVLDGSEIDWSRQAWRTPYELALWAGAPLAAVVFGRAIGGIATFAAFLFVGVQAVAAVVQSMGVPVEQRIRWQEPPPALFEFAEAPNVIHLVLDEFQSDVLGEIVELERSWFDERFAGFTYFADHLGAFPTTSLAMPAMLTGRSYRNDRPVREFVREGFVRGSVVGELAAQGYATHVTSILPAPWLDDWLGAMEADGDDTPVRFTIRKPFVSLWDYRRFGARQLAELSMFRHAPHAAKPAFLGRSELLAGLFGEGRESETEARRHEASNSAAFFRQFIDNMTVGGDGPAYKLIHLGVPHRPVVLDEACEFVGLVEFSREAYRDQATCAVRLAGDFLDRLRALDLYDRSLIVVSSDHGTDLHPRGFEGVSQSLPPQNGATTPRLHAIVGTGLAVMMIKPPGASGPLAVSTAPTLHTDFPATVLDLLGLPAEYPGEPMFRRDAGAPRDRTYAMYDVSQRFPDGHLARLDFLSVHGAVLDAAGWQYERSVVSPELDLRAGTVEMGSSRAARHLGPGWSVPITENLTGVGEVSYAAGLGGEASLFVTLPREASRLAARLRISSGSGLQAIEIDLDGRPLGRWEPAAGQPYREYAIAIPAESARPEVSHVRFRFVPPSPEDDFGVKFNRITIGK